MAPQIPAAQDCPPAMWSPVSYKEHYQSEQSLDRSCKCLEGLNLHTPQQVSV